MEESTPKKGIPWWVFALIGVTVTLICGGIALWLVVSGAANRLLVGEVSPTAPVAEVTKASGASLAPTSTPPPPPTEESQPTATFTPLPSPSPLPEEGEQTAPIAATPTRETVVFGTFDVYITAPDDTNLQLMRWVTVPGGAKVSEIGVSTAGEQPIRAGEYVYWLAPDSRQPLRADTGGRREPVDFAAPPDGASQYDFLPSALGDYLAWLIVVDGTVQIGIARADGTDARIVAEREAPEGETFELVRVTDDGSEIFFDRRPEAVVDDLFEGYYDIYAVDVSAGSISRLPGEPACGDFVTCGGHVSRDGAWLVRTIPPGLTLTPVVVTNLDSGQVIARLPEETIPEGAQYTFGYPIFTPGGELVYMAGYGAPGLENYQVIFADLISGEQRIVAEVGTARHRPLGWTGGGQVLLTTRSDEYDTWQFDLNSGQSRQIAGLLFVGTVVVEP